MARTTHRSLKGKKLYAVRDKQGRFKDIQSYKRAHAMDMKRSSKKERVNKLVDEIMEMMFKVQDKLVELSNEVN